MEEEVNTLLSFADISGLAFLVSIRLTITEFNVFCVILRSAARFSFTRTLPHRYADFVAYLGLRTVPIVPIGLSPSFAQPLGRSTASLSTCLLAPDGTANTAHVGKKP